MQNMWHHKRPSDGKLSKSKTELSHYISTSIMLVAQILWKSEKSKLTGHTTSLFQFIHRAYIQESWVEVVGAEGVRNSNVDPMVDPDAQNGGHIKSL